MSNGDEREVGFDEVTNCLLLYRLQSIQRKLDKSIFDREAANSEFKVSGHWTEAMTEQCNLTVLSSSL